MILPVIEIFALQSPNYLVSIKNSLASAPIKTSDSVKCFHDLPTTAFVTSQAFFAHGREILLVLIQSCLVRYTGLACHFCENQLFFLRFQIE